MARKLAPWYTEQRWQKPTKEQSEAYEEAFGRKPYKLICKSEDGTLFSMGSYPTKKTKEDLPASYVFARIGKLFGCYDAARVIGAAYSPNMWVNHLFRDDALFLSFSNMEIDIESWEGYDIIVDGWDIVTGLAALRAFSGIPENVLDDLEQAVAVKVQHYKETHPDEGDCIEVADYWNILEEELLKFKNE